MSREIIDIFAECIDAIEGKHLIMGDVLTKYPQHRSTLFHTLHIALTLRSQLAVRQQQAITFKKAIANLSKEQQAVLKWRFLVGLSLLETCALLNKTRAAVQTLQYQAIGSLRQQLEKEEARHE